MVNRFITFLSCILFSIQLLSSSADTLTGPIITEIDTILCEGEVFEGYDQPGIYEDIFPLSSGCDSIRRLTLDYFEPIPVTVIDTCILEGDPFPGISNTIFVGENGCDSVVVLNVTVNLNFPENTVLLCDGSTTYTLPNGTVIDSSGQYIFPAETPCTPGEIWNVTFTEYTETVYDTICPDLNNQTGVHITEGDVCGGEEVLVVLPVPDDILIIEDICEGDSIAINGEFYSDDGTFATQFTADNGCTYTETIDINVIPLVDCTDAVNDPFEEKLKLVVYPNPVNSVLKIDLDNQKTIPKEVFIYNEYGLIVMNTNTNSNEINVEELSAGFYYLEVQLGGNYRPIVKFIKQ